MNCTTRTYITSHRTRSEALVANRNRSAILSVQSLEDRTVPTTYFVTNLTDSDPGSLRDAIMLANANPGPDSIIFQTGLNGTITLASALPTITGDVTITGNGAADNTISGNNLFRIFDINGTGVLNVTISKLTLTKGSATQGGAIQVADEIVTLNGVVVAGNKATSSDGGAVRLNTDGQLQVFDSTISGNTAVDDGGAIYFFLGGQLTLVNSTISGNTAGSGSSAIGGGIYFFGAVTATIRNSTISGNKAGVGGGIGWTGSGGTLLIENSTITANQALDTSATSAGGIRRTAAFTSAKVTSTVIAGNIANTPAVRDWSIPSTVTLNNSFIGVVDGAAFTGSGNITGSASTPADPQLTGLQDNGGPTLTHGPLPGSPLLNAGSNPSGLTTDQRGLGFPRVVGPQVDIGAVEGAISNPTATLASAPNVTTAGGTIYFLEVTFSAFSPELINVATLGTGDVKVVGPSGEITPITFVSSTPATNAASVTAKYSFVPPGGSWDSGDNGFYAISSVTGAVADTAGVTTKAATLGGFTVSAPLLVTNLNDSGPGSLRDAISGANLAPGPNTISFMPGLTGTITLLSSLSITDAVTITGNGPATVVSGNTLVRPFIIGTTGAVILEQLTITAGSGSGGGAIRVNTSGGNLTIRDAAVTNSSSSGPGGGIFLTSSSFLTVERSTISGNTGAIGGGFYFFLGGSFRIIDSTISGNTATGLNGGGGGYFFGTASATPPSGFTPSTVTITNSTIANNQSTAGVGGGLAFRSFNGTALIANSTISTNSAATSGGGIDRNSTSGTITLRNSVVAGNINATAPDIFVNGGNINADFSLIGAKDGLTITGSGNLTGTNASPLNAMLGSLAFNGGPTQTMHPLAGSPLLNAGNNALIPGGVTSDQRGSPAVRIFNTTVDIGAVEFQPYPPTLTINPSTLTYTENDPPLLIDPTLTVTDPESVNLLSAVITIDSGYVNGQDVLSFTPQFGISGSFNPATGKLNLSGTTTTANWQTVLRSVTYVNLSDNPTAGNRQISFVATDQDSLTSLPVSRLINVVPVNDAPTITGVNTTPQTVNDTATINPFSGVSFTDPDSTTITVTVTYTAGNGTFSGGGFTGSPGNYTFTGTPAAASTAIQALVFTPTPNQVTPGSVQQTTFTIVANDGFLSADNSQTKVDAVSINDAPTLTGVTTTTQTINDTATVSPFSGVTIADVDPGQIVTVTITYTAGDGVFSGGGFTGSPGNYTFTGSPAAATTAIKALVFNPTDNLVPVGFSTLTTFTISLQDSPNGIGTPVTNAQTKVEAVSVNDPPSITGTTSTPQTVNDTATLAPFTGVTLLDPDPGQLITVTITYSGSLGSFSGSFSGMPGNYTFTGTAVAATTALQGLVFDPTENLAPPSNTTNVVFTITVNDSLATPVSDAKTNVNIVSINDLPTITGITPGKQTVNDNATLNPFSGVVLGDVDPGQNLTVTITYNAADGVLTGAFSGSPGSYTFTGTPTAVTTAIQALVFNPNDNLVTPGTATTTTFTISVSDGLGTVSNSATVVDSISVNDPPIISGTTTTPFATTDGKPIQVFPTVSFADADPNPITVLIEFPGANGKLTDLGGFIEVTSGKYSFTGSTSAATAAIQGLTFVPTPNQVPNGTTITTTFTISALDGFAPPVIDAKTKVDVLASDDPSQILNVDTTPQFVNDNATIQPFAGIVLFDSDASPPPSVTLTILFDGLNGKLSGGGFTGSNGFYTFVGSFAAAQAALQTVTFVPTANQVMPGKTVTTIFQLSLDDGAFPVVTAQGVTVVATSINDAPIGTPTFVSTAFNVPFASKSSLLTTAVDPDIGQSLSVALVGRPMNGTVDLRPDGTFVYTPASTFTGTDKFSYVIFDGLTASEPIPVTIGVRERPIFLSAAGADAGGAPLVVVYNPDGSRRFAFMAYDTAFTGGVRVATGDVDGDGIEDIITGTGIGGGPHVKIFNGRDASLMSSFFAYVPNFTGGIYVAAGDLDGDGKAEILTGTGVGGGPHVKAFDGSGRELLNFFAYTPTVLGGVNVAVGDLDSDGLAEIVTGVGPGGGPHVKVFGNDGIERRSFFAYELTFVGGVNVAVLDLDGDGKGEIVTAPGVGGGPLVKSFDGMNFRLLNATLVPSIETIGTREETPASTANGWRIAAFDDYQKPDQVLVVGGDGATNFLFVGQVAGRLQPLDDPFGDFLGGVFVG